MHARRGFDRLSRNGERIATAERPGLPARSPARAETAHAPKGFDKLSPNGAMLEGFDRLSPNGERIATAERTSLLARALAHARACTRRGNPRALRSQQQRPHHPCLFFIARVSTHSARPGSARASSRSWARWIFCEAVSGSSSTKAT